MGADVHGALGPAWNEADRLVAFHRYRVLDPPCVPDFDDIAHLVAEICRASPVARQRFLSTC
jgi:hypothetical protein